MTKTFSLARFGAEAKSAIAGSQKRADQLRHAHATALHLLLELLKRPTSSEEGAGPSIHDALAAIGVGSRALEASVLGALAKVSPDGDGRSFLSTEMIELLRRAEVDAGARDVDIGHILHALAQEARGPARDVLDVHRIKAGAFRAFFTSTDDPPLDEEQGEAMLRDFASELRGELLGADERALRERGQAVITRLADQFSSRDGIPGLRVQRESERRIRLERLPRDAHILVEWEADSGAVAIHWRKGTTSNTTRYVWSRTAKRWASIEGSGLYVDLRVALQNCLFPSGS